LKDLEIPFEAYSISDIFTTMITGLRLPKRKKLAICGKKETIIWRLGCPEHVKNRWTAADEGHKETRSRPDLQDPREFA